METKKYVIKIGKNYIAGDKIYLGLPQTCFTIQNAMVFSYEDAIIKQGMICMSSKLIEI